MTCNRAVGIFKTITYNVLQLPEGRDLENEIINLKTKLC